MINIHILLLLIIKTVNHSLQLIGLSFLIIQKVLLSDLHRIVPLRILQERVLRIKHMFIRLGECRVFDVRDSKRLTVAVTVGVELLASHHTCLVFLKSGLHRTHIDFIFV